MQNDIVLKMLNFDLLSHWVQGGGGGGGQNSYYHVASFVIPFNLQHDHVLFRGDSYSFCHHTDTSCGDNLLPLHHIFLSYNGNSMCNG